MFDISQVSRRYFATKLTVQYEDDSEKEISLELEPPKVKVIRKLERIMKDTETQVTELVECMALVLAKNKTGYTLSKELIENSFNTDQMISFLISYFQWVGEAQNRPN